MHARVGDRIRVEAERVGARARVGEVVDVFAGPAGEHYRVRWDSGGETILFPGSAWTVERDEPAEEIALRNTARNRADLAVWVDDAEQWAEAFASVHVRSLEITGFGRAERHHDPPEPRGVVAELAIARALSDVAGQLRALAALQMESRRPRPVRAHP